MKKDVAILFDLDNTLYDAEQYFNGAFKEISKYLDDKYGINKNESHKNLLKLWKEKTSMYPYLFNDFLKMVSTENKKNIESELENIIKIFNGHYGKLKLYSDVTPVLKKFRNVGYKMGIITDGTVERQKRKIKLLNVEEFFDVVIYTKELESPKPSTVPFLKALKELHTKPQNSFYVADNPLIDFEGAKKIDMKTVRIMRGEFKNKLSNEFVDYNIITLEDLITIVRT